MTFTVLSLFPEILEGFFQTSLMKKARDKGLITVNLVNIRDFAHNRHKTCDDVPYGGGAGMVLKPEPLAEALDSVGALAKRTLYPTPSGRTLTQRMVEELAKEDELVLICGRYEGIDQRIIDEYVDEEISIGDYVLSSGEIASLVLIDAIYRLRDGVIKPRSLEEESFSGAGLLEYPQYTRPEVFRGRSVPEVLLSGHHGRVADWRTQKSVEKTKRLRPDLLDRLGHRENEEDCHGPN